MTGLLILVVAVFAFVGYNGYSAKRHMITDDVSESDSPEPAPSTAGKEVAPEVKETPQTKVPEASAQPASSVGEPQARIVAGASTDSLPAQPGEGAKFGNGGRYQLYRQGDMTWRLNVETGETCVLLATDAEWHKERVYRSGCRGRG